MDGYELNKVFGALTGALLVFFGVSFVSEAIFHQGGHGHGEQELAYSIPIEDEEAEEEVAEAEPELPLTDLIAAADVGDGERLFRRCSACHNVDPGGRNGVGPALHGVMGREIAAVDGYEYSDALGGMGGVWDWEAMSGFLEAPREWAPGTKMNFAGFSDAEDRANMMVYLNAQSDAPIEPPAE